MNLDSNNHSVFLMYYHLILVVKYSDGTLIEVIRRYIKAKVERMNKAYKYRIYPNEEQAELINKTFGCVRFVYNQMLANRKAIYEQFKDDKEALKKQKYTTPAGYKAEFVWLKEVDSLALANAQLNLNTAYSNFFRDKYVGFPQFKSKHKDRKSYTTNNQDGTIRLICESYIRVPKLKDIKIKLHRQIPDDCIIKSATIGF